MGEAIYYYNEPAITGQQQTYAAQIKPLTARLKVSQSTSEVYQRQIQQLLITVKQRQLSQKNKEV